MLCIRIIPHPLYIDIIRAPFDDWRRGGEGGGQAETGQQVELESFSNASMFWELESVNGNLTSEEIGWVWNWSTKVENWKAQLPNPNDMKHRLTIVFKSQDKNQTYF